MLNPNVTISYQKNGNVVTIPVPYTYCASIAGAQAMVDWLAANGKVVTIFQAYPLYPSGIGNLDPESQEVPWLTDGTTDNNCGPLISAFIQAPLPNGGYIGIPYSNAVTEVLVNAWATS